MEALPNIKSPVRLPRFSLRCLLVLVTFASIYLGGWVITKAWVVDDHMREPDLRCVTPVPYLAVLDELDAPNYRYLRRCHFCCVGLKVRLPFAWECSDRKPLVMGGVIPKIIIQEEEDRLGIVVP